MASRAILQRTSRAFEAYRAPILSRSSSAFDVPTVALSVPARELVHIPAEDLPDGVRVKDQRCGPISLAN
jgi:hypothetical protein